MIGRTIKIHTAPLAVDTSSSVTTSSSSSSDDSPTVPATPAGSGSDPGSGTGSESDDSISPPLLDPNEGYGYHFGSYLSGKKLTDAVLTLWHILLALCAAVTIAISYTYSYHLDVFIKIIFQNLDSRSTYKQFTREPTSDTVFHFHEAGQKLSYFFMVVNSIYIGCVLSYMTFRFHKFRLALPLACLVSTNVVLVEIAMVNIFHTPAMLLDEDEVMNLQHRLQNEYKVMGTDDFSVAQDVMSVWLKCCGVVDSFDYHNSTLILPQGTSLTEIQVPPSCCKREVYRRGFTHVYSCINMPEEDDVYKNGCMDASLNKIKDICHLYGLYVWLHVLDCTLHAYFYRRRVTFCKELITSAVGPSNMAKI